MKITFSNGNVYFEPGKFDDYDNYDDCYEQQEFQPVSYHDPNDGKVTPQESQIRQDESRIEQSNDTLRDSAIGVGAGAAGAGIGIATDQPVATVMGGGQVMYSFGRATDAYQTREMAQARYDQKVQEERDYLEKVKD